MLDKDDLINILIDWVEGGEKVENDKIDFVDIEDIKKVCGGWWRSSINGENFIDNPVPGNKLTNDNPKRYLEIKDNMIKSEWLKSEPAILNFIDTKEKKEDGWISDIMVSDGNHRIAIVDLYKVNTKIPIKFAFNEYSYLENRWGKKPLKHDKNGNVYWPLRKMIKYEYDK